MFRAQPKTLTPVLLLRILEEYSDEKHPLTREEIERLLDEKYGITMERKAFFRHIKNLQRLDNEGIYVYRVTMKPKGPDEPACAGFYLGDRVFSELDLRVLIDALAGSHYMSQWETEDFIERLASLRSRYFRKKIESYQFVGGGAKTKNKTLMNNLEIIDEAITEQKQISFRFLRTNSKGQQEVSDAPPEVCTPIRYFVKDHNYYLIVAVEVEEELRNMVEGDLRLKAYTLSDIDCVEILDTPAQDYHSIPEYRHGIDWKKLLREHSNMKWLWGKPELCTFLCQCKYVEEIAAHFGDEIRVRQLNDQELEKLKAVFGKEIPKNQMVEVSVITDRYVAAEFARGYYHGLWVIAPKPARAISRSLTIAQLEYYDKLEQHYVTGPKFVPMNLRYNPLETQE